MASSCAIRRISREVRWALILLTGKHAMSTPLTTQQPEPEEARVHRAELVRAIRGDVEDVHVLDAIGRVPRHLFMPGVSIRRAYANQAAPIGYQQTISLPTVVGMMSSALELTGKERVLEIGTGSGYQTAVLSLLSALVYSIETVPELAEQSRERLSRLGYTRVLVRTGDGFEGWQEAAPFDRIIVTAAPCEVPPTLFDQLSSNGVLVAPVGRRSWTQSLMRYRKTAGRIACEDLGAVSFVPMIHIAEKGWSS
jgi:protein-L-isoaspartate(D-aspartate) O-methyltransferase